MNNTAGMQVTGLENATDYLSKGLEFLLGELDFIATIGLILTLIFFIIQQKRANRIEKNENYLRLELASNELFQFEAANAELMNIYDVPERPAGYVADQVAETRMTAFHFMTLNLFEISTRLRWDSTIEADVYGSWVIWYYNTMEGWYFRENWPEYRMNYTPQLRNMFDGFIAEWDPEEDDEARTKRFFDHVADVYDCPVVRKWLTS